MKRQPKAVMNPTLIGGICDGNLMESVRQAAEECGETAGFCSNVNELIGRLLRSEARVVVVETEFVDAEIPVFLDIIHRLYDRLQVLLIAPSSAQAHVAGIETGRGIAQIFTSIPSEPTLRAFLEQARQKQHEQAFRAPKSALQ